MARRGFGHVYTAACVVLFAGTTAAAETVTWTGLGMNSNSWHDPGNWQDESMMPGVPQAGDDVVIPNVMPTAVVIYSMGNTPLNSLTCDEDLVLSGGTIALATASSVTSTLTLNGATIGGEGDLTIDGLLTWSAGSIIGSGAVNADGGLDITGMNNKFLNGTRILNNGGAGSWTGAGDVIGELSASFNNLASASFTLLNTSTWENVPFSNAGVFTKMTSPGASTFNAMFTNSGTVDVESGILVFTSYTQAAGSTNLTGGNLATSLGLTLTAGDLTGSGTIGGSVFNEAGEVHPGGSAGLLAIDGNYVQGAAAVLNIELGGTDPIMDYDQLEIAGGAALNGTLDITLINGFMPMFGNSFEVVLCGLRLQQFCELSTGGLGGGLFYDLSYAMDGLTIQVVGLDPDLDCNSNGILDACDIEECAGSPDCDDCNLNEIPDECDIADGTSADDNMDGVPDECAQPMISGNWTADATWDFPGGGYPDNVDSIPDVHVTLGGPATSVFLDDTVEIETLRLLAGATLEVTQAGAGDLDLVDVGGILIKGNMLVDEDRVIDATGGAVNIRSGGTYRADPGAVGPVSASLTAETVRIEGGPPGMLHGAMVLTDNMTLSCTTDLIIDGTPAAGSGAAALGDGSPPDFRTEHESGVNVDGNAVIVMDGDAAVLGGDGIQYYSSEPLTLAGNFVNLCTNPTLFDWLSGSLEMDGAVPQTIQAAGEDRGPSPAGLVVNYAFGALIVADGGNVKVVDNFDNQQDGEISCDEALYVVDLVVEQGATLTTDRGCVLYYKELTNDGSIPGLGAAVVEICDADLDGDTEIGVTDLLALIAAWGPNPNHPADIDGDGIVGVTDLLVLLADWGRCP